MAVANSQARPQPGWTNQTYTRSVYVESLGRVSWHRMGNFVGVRKYNIHLWVNPVLLTPGSAHWREDVLKIVRKQPSARQGGPGERGRD